MATEIVRALDIDGDWTFGQGINNYKSANLAIAQDIQCNLSMFLGDCFFATSNGIDWFNLLGGKNLLAINLAVNATILNTVGVTGLQQSNISLSATRALTITYSVQTVYSVLQGTYIYDFGLAA